MRGLSWKAYLLTTDETPLPVKVRLCNKVVVDEAEGIDLAPSGLCESGSNPRIEKSDLCLNMHVYILRCFQKQKWLSSDIRGCSARVIVLAQLSDYWNVVFDENMASDITGERFQKPAQ